MRQKEIRLIITFHTSADCFALEKVCKQNNLIGRIIPIPRVISSGCGLAWCCDISNKDEVLNLMLNANIEFEGIFEHLM